MEETWMVIYKQPPGSKTLYLLLVLKALQVEINAPVDRPGRKYKLLEKTAFL